MKSERFEVVIVGGRCAGAAAAAMFARAGRSVLVLDRASFPSDTLSSHTMFAATVEEIRLIGAEPFVRALDPPDIRTAHLEFSDGTYEPYVLHEQIPEKDAFTVTSVRRDLLDQALVDNARNVGAEIRERCNVTNVRWRGGRAVGVTYVDPDGEEHHVDALLTLGADGQYSSIAELVGAYEPYRYSHSERGAVYRYIEDPITTGPEATTVYHWRQGTSLGFGFPTTPRGLMLVMFIDDRSEIALARREPEVYWQSKLDQHPPIAKRLAGAAAGTPLRITDQLSSYFRTATGPGWGLIGDAGHFKDPIIGQGMRDAMWGGRMICEFAEPHLNDPAAMDRALRRWEATRERECISAYLLAVLESHLTPDSDGLRMLAGAFGDLRLPIVGPLGSRDGRPARILRPASLGKALLRVLKTSRNRRATIRDLVHEACIFCGILLNARRSRFRESSALLSLENVSEGWPRKASCDDTARETA